MKKFKRQPLVNYKISSETKKAINLWLMLFPIFSHVWTSLNSGLSNIKWRLKKGWVYKKESIKTCYLFISCDEPWAFKVTIGSNRNSEKTGMGSFNYQPTIFLSVKFTTLPLSKNNFEQQNISENPCRTHFSNRIYSYNHMRENF